MEPLHPSKQLDNLSHQDALCLLELIHASLSCATEEGFRKLMAGVKNLVSFDYAACLMGRKSGKNAVVSYELINVSYPDEWLYHYVENNYHLIDPIVKENFTNYSLQYWQDTYKKRGTPKKFVKGAEDFNLRKGYSIGQTNLTLTEGSLFSFAGDSIEHTARTEVVLRRIIPHLHRAFNQLLNKEEKKTRPVSLTGREREILLWLKEGKSTWDVSRILGISQDTVKFHLKNIYHKLNTTNRSHAIAVALGNKLIDF
jgi:LuxR family transcriptional regulator, quorum-sensing system regulator CviR